MEPLTAPCQSSDEVKLREVKLRRQKELLGCCGVRRFLGRLMGLTFAVFQMRAHESLEQFKLGGVSDEHVFGDGVKATGNKDCIPPAGDQAVVDSVKLRHVLVSVCPNQGIIIPSAGFHERPRQTIRRNSQRGHPLGCFVDHGPYELDLRIEHLMNANEVPANHIPMCVLEGELEVVERVEPCRQSCSCLSATARGPCTWLWKRSWKP